MSLLLAFALAAVVPQIARPSAAAAQTTQTTTPLDICGVLQAATPTGLTFTINGLNITYPLASTNSVQVPPGEVGKSGCLVGQTNTQAPAQIESGTFSDNFSATVVVCGTTNSYVPAAASSMGFISIGATSILIGINANFTGTAIAVGRNICIKGQVNALGQLTVGTVSVNTGGTAPLTPVSACGTVSSYTAPGGSTSGTITIATPTVTVTFPIVAAATINPSSFTGTGNPSVCFTGAMNGGGQLIQATFTPSSTQNTTLCGVVTAYTSATSAQTGSLTIGGVVVPLALSATFSGQPVVLEDNVCVHSTFNSLGQLVTGSFAPDPNPPSETATATAVPVDTAVPATETVTPTTALPTSSVIPTPATSLHKFKPITATNAHVLARSDARHLQGRGQVSGSVFALTFTNPTARLRSLRVGNVVVIPNTAKTPGGLLGRVTNIKRTKGQMTVKFAYAGLFDAFTQGSFNLPLSFANHQPLNNVNVAVNNDGQTQAGLTATVNGSLDFSGSATLQAAWQLGQSFQTSFAVSGTESVDLDLNLDGSGTVHAEHGIGGVPIKNFPPKTPADMGVPLPPVPIPGLPGVFATPNLQFKVAADGHIDGSLEPHVKAVFTVKGSITCPDTDALHCYPGSGLSGSFPLKQVTLTGSAGVKLSLGAELHVDIDHAPGPYLGVDGYVELRNDVNPTGTLYGGIEGTVGYDWDMTVFSHKVVSLHAQYQLAKWERPLLDLVPQVTPTATRVPTSVPTATPTHTLPTSQPTPTPTTIPTIIPTLTPTPPVVCSKTLGQRCTAIWTNKSQYNIGESAQICYSVAQPGPFEIIDFPPGQNGTVTVQSTDDGTGGCFNANISPPTGTERVRIETLFGTSVLSAAETTFLVVGASGSTGFNTTAPAWIPGESTLADVNVPNGSDIGPVHVGAWTPGGVNTAPCTSVNTSSTRFTVPIANANGFQPGLTVTAYSTISAFNTQAVNLVVTAISGNVLTLQVETTSGVTDDAFCSDATAAGTLVFEVEQIGIPVPAQSVASLTAGRAITLQQTNGASTVATVYPGLSNMPITAGNTVFLSDAQGIASALADCLISRTRTGGLSSPVSTLSVQAGNCEPGLDFLGPQTQVTVH